jgi:hypothetical protein
MKPNFFDMKPITAFFVSLSLLASFSLLGQENITPEKNEALKKCSLPLPLPTPKLQKHSV